MFHYLIAMHKIGHYNIRFSQKFYWRTSIISLVTLFESKNERNK